MNNLQGGNAFTIELKVNDRDIMQFEINFTLGLQLPLFFEKM